MTDNYDAGIAPHPDHWVLATVMSEPGEPDRVITSGTEQEVRAAGEDLIMHASSASRAAYLYAEIYIERPDGSHESFDYGDGTFILGERPKWIAVDW